MIVGEVSVRYGRQVETSVDFDDLWTHILRKDSVCEEFSEEPGVHERHEI